VDQPYYHDKQNASLGEFPWRFVAFIIPASLLSVASSVYQTNTAGVAIAALPLSLRHKSKKAIRICVLIYTRVSLL
jgi:hypothetical protein